MKGGMTKEEALTLARNDMFVLNESYRQRLGVLRYDRDVVLTAIKSHNGIPLHFAPEQFRDDKEMVLAALKTGGPPVLEIASPRLKKDKEVVLEAVKHIGSELRHADAELRADNEVIAAAVAQNPRARQFAVTMI